MKSRLHEHFSEFVGADPGVCSGLKRFSRHDHNRFHVPVFIYELFSIIKIQLHEVHVRLSNLAMFRCVTGFRLQSGFVLRSNVQVEVNPISEVGAKKTSEYFGRSVCCLQCVIESLVVVLLQCPPHSASMSVNGYQNSSRLDPPLLGALYLFIPSLFLRCRKLAGALRIDHNCRDESEHATQEPLKVIDHRSGMSQAAWPREPGTGLSDACNKEHEHHDQARDNHRPKICAHRDAPTLTIWEQDKKSCFGQGPTVEGAK
jgi:hypothetical protein